MCVERDMKLSTIVILVGVVFLFIPIPPIATIIGVVTILAGVALRALTNK
jgi:xanthosine utilization system XapX-like protein